MTLHILLVSWFDNAAQLQLLAEAIRKYTEHDALHLNMQPSYLGYKSDVAAADYKSPTGLLELRQKIKGYDDFFIFGEFLPKKSQFEGFLKNLQIFSKIKRENTVIRTGGTIPRNKAAHYLIEQIKEGWVYTGAYHDFSISPYIGFIAPTRNIAPLDKIPKPKPPKDGKVIVTFSPTKAEKGLDEFNRVMGVLTKEYDNVEPMLITGKSWKEAIEIKSKANVTFDTIWRGTYANSSIESMYLSHAVLSNIDPWTYLCYPDLPIVNTPSERALYTELKKLAEDQKQIDEIGKKGKAFVEKYHSPEVVVKQWEYLIEYVRNINIPRRA